MNKSIEINKNNLKLLEKAYKKAEDEKLSYFTFNDEKLLTSYAKYAIQYMRSTLCGS